MLDTKRTATVSATVPCEVIKLERRFYERVLEQLPAEAQISALDRVSQKFWELMQNEAGRSAIDVSSLALRDLHIVWSGDTI